MRNRKVTDAERAEILRRTRAGQKQKQIAQSLRLCKGTVAKIERENGLQRHPGFVPTRQQEKNVVALFKAGWGQPRIVKATGVPGHIVYEIRDRHGLRRAPGTAYARYRFTTPQLRAIRRRIRQSERAIAHEFGVTHSWLKAFRRGMWNNSGEQHWRRKKLAAPQEISADKFVETYFQFAPRPHAVLSADDIQRAAELCLKLRTEFFGKPADETEYLSGLRSAVAAHLGCATENGAWVH